MTFQFPEDIRFFHDLLCDEGEDLDKYADLFDLRAPHTLKRKEMTSAKHKAAWEELERKFGRICQLQYVEDCDLHHPSTIDHVIPLGTNKRNKSRGGVPLAKGKKVGAESFGSNHISNLVLACERCNKSKKHRLLDRERMRRILKTKGY